MLRKFKFCILQLHFVFILISCIDSILKIYIKPTLIGIKKRIEFYRRAFHFWTCLFLRHNQRTISQGPYPTPWRLSGLVFIEESSPCSACVTLDPFTIHG